MDQFTLSNDRHARNKRITHLHIIIIIFSALMLLLQNLNANDTIRERNIFPGNFSENNFKFHPGLTKDSLKHTNKPEVSRRVIESSILSLEQNFISRPDSSVTYAPSGEKINKVIYLFDKKSKKVSLEVLNWDSSVNAWIPERKTMNDFDEYGNTILEEDYYWDASLSDWAPNSKTISRYDQQKRHIYFESYYWGDSGWIGSSKEIKKYDERGNTVFQEYYFWDDNANTWIGSSRNIMITDEKNRPVLYEYYFWDSEREDWQGASKSEYTYNQRGMTIFSENSAWDNTTWEWFIMNKMVSEYDNEDVMISHEQWDYDAENGVLRLHNQIKPIYDETGLLLYKINLSLNYDNGMLEEHSKDVYDYDDEKRPVLITTYSKNPDTNEWYNHSKIERNYPDNNTIEIISYNWNAFQNAWEETIKYYNQYDTKEHLIYQHISLWNRTVNEWTDSFLSSYNYDEYGNQTYLESYRWNASTGSWTGQTKLNLLFDEKGRQLLSESYKWDESIGSWIGQYSKYVYNYDRFDNQVLAERYEWDAETNDWVGRSKNIQEYNDLNLQILDEGFEWDNTNKTWRYNNRRTYTYDGDTLREYAFLRWDVTTNSWKYSYKTDYIYNDTGDLILENYYSAPGSSDLSLFQWTGYYYSRIGLSETSVHFTANGGTSSIDVSSNTDWEITTTGNQLVINPTEGSNDKTFSITAGQNTTNTEYIDTIYVGTRNMELKVLVTQEAPVDFELSEDTLRFGPTGGKEYIDVISGLSWEAQTAAEWLTVAPEAGTGNGSFSVLCDTNRLYSERKAEIIVSAENETPKIIQVIQEASLYIKVSEEVLHVSENKENRLLIIESNTEWTITSNAEWINISRPTGSGTGSTVITIFENPGSERISSLTVKGKGLSPITITVFQEASDYLEVSMNEIIASAQEKEYSITVISNTNWIAESKSDWVEVETYDGRSSGELAVRVKENNTGIERRGEVILRYGDSNSVIINILQKASNFLHLSGNEFSTDSEGETLQVEVFSNIRWDVHTTRDWLTIQNESGMNNGTFYITVQANQGEERVGLVQVTGNGSTEVITITQEASESTGSESIESDRPTIYPNPVREGFRVKGITNATLTIFDMTGRRLLIQKITNDEFVPFNEFPKGVYIVNIKNESVFFETKIMKR